MNAAVQNELVETVEPIAAKTTTALAVVTQSIAEFNAIEVDIGELEHQYKGVVFDVKTPAGMKAACEARLAVRKPRYSLQNMQKNGKKLLNALKDAIDERAESIIVRVAAIEDPIHEQISNEETRKEAEKEAKRVAEQKRVDDIQERINDLRESVTLAAGKTAAEIATYIADTEAIAIDDTFAEFQPRAETAKAATLMRLRAAHATAANMEAAQKKLDEERVELARQKVAEELRQAQERERIAEEQRAARKAADAEAVRQAEQLRKQREEQQAEVNRVRLQNEAQAAAERKRIEAEEADLQRRVDAQLAESTRLENERKERAREQAESDAARRAEAQRLADERAQLERDREALRVDQESAAAPTPPVPDAVITASQINAATLDELKGDPAFAVQPIPKAETVLRWRPKDEAIIHLLSTTYNAPRETVVSWLVDMARRLAERSAA